MKHTFAVPILLVGILVASGCQKQQKAPSDGIREAIREHLSSLNTLNLSAMEMKLANVSVNGDTAQAQVEYVPKTGAPPGAAMHVSYSLEKRGEQWVVVKTNSLGGAINHPDPRANPHTPTTTGDVHGTLPNFRDLIPSTTPDANATLPPGHPQIPSAQKSSP